MILVRADFGDAEASDVLRVGRIRLADSRVRWVGSILAWEASPSHSFDSAPLGRKETARKTEVLVGTRVLVLCIQVHVLH